jgi:hypothetical protein
VRYRDKKVANTQATGGEYGARQAGTKTNAPISDNSFLGSGGIYSLNSRSR